MCQCFADRLGVGVVCGKRYSVEWCVFGDDVKEWGYVMQACGSRVVNCRWTSRVCACRSKCWYCGRKMCAQENVNLEVWEKSCA